MSRMSAIDTDVLQGEKRSTSSAAATLQLYGENSDMKGV